MLKGLMDACYCVDFVRWSWPAPLLNHHVTRRGAMRPPMLGQAPWTAPATRHQARTTVAPPSWCATSASPAWTNRVPCQPATFPPSIMGDAEKKGERATRPHLGQFPEADYNECHGQGCHPAMNRSMEWGVVCCPLSRTVLVERCKALHKFHGKSIFNAIV